jgi:hypothetical protein
MSKTTGDITQEISLEDSFESLEMDGWVDNKLIELETVKQELMRYRKSANDIKQAPIPRAEKEDKMRALTFDNVRLRKRIEYLEEEIADWRKNAYRVTETMAINYSHRVNEPKDWADKTIELIKKHSIGGIS